MVTIPHAWLPQSLVAVAVGGALGWLGGRVLGEILLMGTQLNLCVSHSNALN